MLHCKQPGKPIRVSLTGKAKSGKNTIGNIISSFLQKRNLTVQQEAFADPMKEIILITFPSAKRENLFGPSELREEVIPGVFRNGKPLTYRQALKDIGSDCFGQSYIPSIWNDNMEYRIVNPKSDAFIITDLRFIHEIDLVNKYNFINVKVIRDNNSTDTHASESQQDLIPLSNYKFIINNNSTIKHLEAIVELEIIPYLLENS
jgi:hypothetical protein